MKTALFSAMITLAVGSFAHADGFMCKTESGLSVKVFNHTNPRVGTRVAAVMVISDGAVAAGRKTIARFDETKGTLSSIGTEYTANVDLRFTDSSRRGELIAGTKLGFIDTITLKVGFNYATPVPVGTRLPAHLLIEKRNGEVITERALCLRYLKNS